MCGIAGAFQLGDSPITISSIMKIAKGIQKRGPHAWGMSWIDQNNRIHAYKAPGKIVDAMHMIERLHDFNPIAIIMHTRFSTHGSPSINHNNHPHACDGGWFVHNGQIPNWADLILDHNLMPITECDSEVLGLLIQSRNESLLRRCRFAINQTDQTRPLCMAGIWSRPNRAIVAKRGNPLMYSYGRSGNFYFSTLQDGLPVGSGMPSPITDNKVFSFDMNSKTMATEPLLPFIDTGRKFAGSGETMSTVDATRDAVSRLSAKGSKNQYQSDRSSKKAKRAKRATRINASGTAQSWEYADA